MNAKSLIKKTRDGEALTPEEIKHIVEGAVSGRIPSYQLTAWMMAVYLRGFTREETVVLTRAMIDSGDRLNVAGSGFLPADKHSTGGVGDKISFLVAPLVAAAGVPVPMISGRSLGHTGGTLDKLESIPGFRTMLEPTALVRQVEEIGLFIAGQTERLVPADRILYALRDAASIVESVPLITASILSKKAAAGVKALVLDVKCGTGAFMAGVERGNELARSLVQTAGLVGMRARAHLTSMDSVLGRTAGNSLEIAESIRFLRGEEVSPVLAELAFTLGASMLELSGRAASAGEARALLERVWRSGEGLEKFRAMVAAQGGRADCVDDLSLLPRSAKTLEVDSPEAGLFLGIEARPAGEWITEAGGGRLRAGDPIDPRVGLEVLSDPGTPVQKGAPLLRLHLGNVPPAPDLGARAARWIRLRTDSSAAAAFEERGEEAPALPKVVLGDPIDSEDTPG